VPQPCAGSAPGFRAVAFFPKYDQPYDGASRGKDALLNFRFLQTIQAIRLVRGTTPSCSSLDVAGALVSIGLADGR
jgi:hypothetical protein